MSGKKPIERKPSRAYGLTKSQWHEVQAILRMWRGIPQEVLEQQSEARRVLRRYELLSPELESAHQFSASITRQIVGDLAQVSEYLQRMKGLRLYLRHIEGVEFIASTLSAYYRELVDLASIIHSVPEILIRPNIEVSIPAALLVAAGEQAARDIVQLVQDAGSFATEIVADMVSDIDRAAWAVHLGASSSWRNYKLDTSRLIPSVDEVDLPGSILDQYPRMITEAVDPGQVDAGDRYRRFVEEIRAWVAEGARRFDELDRGSSQPKVRVSGEVVDGNSTEDTPPIEVTIEDGSVVVRTPLPVVVVRPLGRQVVRVEDVEADSDLLVLSAGDDTSARRKIIAFPRHYPDPESITLTWWLDDQHSLCMKAIVGDTVLGELKKYRTRDGKLSKEAELLFMLLHRHNRGLTFRDAVEGLYPDELECVGRDPRRERTLIMRMRSAIGQIRKRFYEAGIDPDIVPMSWGVGSMTKPITIKAANIVDIEGCQSENTNLRFVPLYEEMRGFGEDADDDNDSE